jgi:hypothetical protein
MPPRFREPRRNPLTVVSAPILPAAPGSSASAPACGVPAETGVGRAPVGHRDRPALRDMRRRPSGRQGQARAAEPSAGRTQRRGRGVAGRRGRAPISPADAAAVDTGPHSETADPSTLSGAYYGHRRFCRSEAWRVTAATHISRSRRLSGGSVPPRLSRSRSWSYGPALSSPPRAPR